MESVTQESDNSNQIENTNEVQNGTVKGNSDVLVGETYFDYFERLGIENIDDYYNNVLFPSVNSDFPQIMPFASWPGGTGDFWTTNGYTPTNILAMKIGPGFTSWETNGWTTEAIWKDTVLRALQNSFTATNTRINETNNAISALKAMDTHLSNEVNKFGPHITNLWNSVTSINGKISSIESVNTLQGNSLTSQYNQIQAINTNITDLWTGHVSQANSLTGLNNRLVPVEENITKIWKQFTIVDGSLSNLVKRADAVDTNIKDLWTGHVSQANSLTGLNNRLDPVEENITKIWKQFTTVDGSLSNLVKRADAVDINITKLWDNAASQDDRLKKIESFDFGSVIDLTVLVTAINSVGTKVQKLVDLFNVTKVEPGTFTFFLQGSIKTQTDAITQALAMVDESLNDNFINYFDDSKNGKFWTAFKKFSDFQMAVFFGVFFETLDEKWEENWLDILETWNITNDLLLLSNQWLDLINSQLSSANNTLAIVTQWLKQIYEKPLGNINNEAGTNLWDFLESIVDNLGEIITTQLKEFVKVLDKILDFLDGLIDKIIGLLIPEDTNFITNGFEGIKVKFNVKFGALLGLADSLKDLFTPTPRDFKQAVSFDFLGAKFEPDFSMIDPYVKKFRVVMSLSLWMSVVVFIFRKITGTGDLVNDN